MFLLKGPGGVPVRLHVDSWKGNLWFGLSNIFFQGGPKMGGFSVWFPFQTARLGDFSVPVPKERERERERERDWAGKKGPQQKNILFAG